MLVFGNLLLDFKSGKERSDLSRADDSSPFSTRFKVLINPRVFLNFLRFKSFYFILIVLLTVTVCSLSWV